MKRSLTRRLALSVVALVIQFPFCFAQTNTKSARATARPVKPETPHLEFVTEYIRELSAIERIRTAGQDENNQDKKDDKLPFAGAIHTSTLAFYERKIVLWQRMREISSAFIGGPKDGVDYSKLAAEMPQPRGKLDFIDQALFEATPSVFATLIDMKEDSKGRASHLIITKEEKTTPTSKLDDSFGTKLEQKDQNYTVSSA